MEKVKLSFEEKMTKLDSIVEKMNSSSLSLNEMLKLYDEAQILIKELSKELKNAKETINKDC